jgi:hypothetical protein
MTSLNFLMLLDINPYTYNTYVYVWERQMISNQRPWRYRKKELQGNNFFKFFFFWNRIAKMCTYRLYLPLSIAQDELEKPLFHDFTQFYGYDYYIGIITFKNR